MLAAIMAKRHDHTDRTPAPRAQVASDRARSEIMLIRKLPDALRRSRINDLLAGKRPRHRGGGYARQLGKIIDSAYFFRQVRASVGSYKAAHRRCKRSAERRVGKECVSTCQY